ncbi:hypothetical protein ACI79C_03955 [Geodermatophilus sp. SYSU D00697]
MSREIPQAIRAVAGLAATVLDEARRLPQTLPALPVRVIGLAMQATMKLQQSYAGLVARGDEVFTGIRGEDEPGLATFDEDRPAAPSGNGVHTSAFDRAADTAADTVGDEELAEEVAHLIDDEVSGLPPEPAPEEVVEALQDITDEVQAAHLDLAQPGLTTEDALETALLEADGAPDSALVDGGTTEGSVDTDLIAESPTDLPEAIPDEAPTTAPSDPGGSPVGELDGAPAVETADVATDVDVITPDGEVATVEGTVTDEGVAAPETAEEPAPPADTAADVDVVSPDGEVATVEGTVTDEGVAAPETAEEPAAPADAAEEVLATDEGGTTVAAATGHRTDVEETTPAEADEAADTAGAAAAGAAPVEGYDNFTIAQLRGRLRGYQLATVQDLVAYEEATRSREPYLRMLRNRLEKLERQAVEASPLAPRGM